MSNSDCDPDVSLRFWESFPEVSICEEQGSGQSLGIVEGFEELLKPPPRTPIESFAVHDFAQPVVSSTTNATTESRLKAASAQFARTTTESRQFKNRMAQKRLRQRHKERTESLERELARTSAQLNQLQCMQTAINANLQMLTKLLQLNEQAQPSAVELPKSTATVKDLYKQRGFKSSPDPVFAANFTEPALRLTMWETGEQFMSVQQIGQLQLQEFSKVYTAYIHQMAACLAKLTQEGQAEGSHAPVMQRMHELVIECSSLLLITLMSNPSMYKDLQHCRFDEGTVCFDAQLPMDCCSVLEAMQYSEHQIEDLLELRLLFCHRIGQLARERQSLLDNLACCKMDGNNDVCDRLTEMAKWADLLKENGAEEHRSYMQIITSSCRGVSTSKQLATGFVCAFPRLMRMSHLVQAAAARRGLPSMQHITADTTVCDAQHAANWAKVSQYLEGVTERDLDVHVPFLMSEDPLVSWQDVFS